MCIQKTREYRAYAHPAKLFKSFAHPIAPNCCSRKAGSIDMVFDCRSYFFIMFGFFFGKGPVIIHSCVKYAVFLIVAFSQSFGNTHNKGVDWTDCYFHVHGPSHHCHSLLDTTAPSLQGSDNTYTEHIVVYNLHQGYSPKRLVHKIFHGCQYTL